MRDCTREADSRQLKRHASRILSPVFHAKDAATARAMHRVACGMLRDCCPKAVNITEKAELDVLAFLASPVPLEAAAHEQPAGAHQPRDKAPQLGRAGVPLRGVVKRLVRAVMCEQERYGRSRATSLTKRSVQAFQEWEPGGENKGDAELDPIAAMNRRHLSRLGRPRAEIAPADHEAPKRRDLAPKR